MSHVKRAQVRFADLKKQPLKADGGRIYIFSRKAAGQGKQAHSSFAAWTIECQTSKDGKFTQIFNGTKLKPTTSVTVTRSEPGGHHSHLALFTDKPVSADYLKKHWKKVLERATVFDESQKNSASVTLDSAGNWLVLLDTAGLPFGAEGRCDSIGLALRKQTGALEASSEDSVDRRPSPSRVIELVADPGFVWTFDPKGLQFKKAQETPDMLGDWEKTKKKSPKKTFKGWAKDKANALKGAKKTELKNLRKQGKTWGDLEGSLDVAISGDGAATIVPAFECANEKCKKQGDLRLGGAKRANVKAATKLSLPDAHPPNPNNLQVPGNPTVYELDGKACDGKDQHLTVKVYPSSQFLVDAKWSSEYVGKKFDKLNKYCEGLNKKAGLKKGASVGAFGVGFEGSIKYLSGWRERDGDWRVYFRRSVAAEAGLTLTLPSFTLSAAQWGLGIPQSVSDYIADIRLSFTLSAKGSIGGEASLGFEHASGPLWGGMEGSIEFKLSLTLTIEAKGYVGKPDAAGAQVSASVAPTVSVKAAASANSHGQVAVEFPIVIEPCSAEVHFIASIPIRRQKKIDFVIAKMDILKDPVDLKTFGPYLLAQ